MTKKSILFHNSKDEGIDAAYIYLVNPADLKSNSQMTIDKHGVGNAENFKGEVVLDLDSEGRILGIEILGDVLPKSIEGK